MTDNQGARLPFRVIAAWLLMLSSVAAAQPAGTWTDIAPSQYSAILAIHPVDGRLLATTYEGTRVSADRGRSWSAPDSNLRLPTWILAHPGRPGLVLAEAGGRVYRSDDLGESWTVLGESTPRAFAVATFATDPRNPDRLLATTLSRSQYVMWFGTTFPPTDQTIVESLDEGRTWQAAGTGLPDFSGLSLSHQFKGAASGPTPAANQRLWFATRSAGVYVSRDSARTWHGFPLRLVAWVKPHPFDSRVLYTLELTPLPDSPGFSGAILRTDDEGHTWRPILRIDQPISYLHSGPTLEIDPVHGRELWLAGLEAGVIHSADGGEGWRHVGFGAPAADKVLLSPSEPGVAYVHWRGRIFRGRVSPPSQPVATEFSYEGPDGQPRYWLSAASGESYSQDYRAEPGRVARTGARFGVWRPGEATPGAQPVCRFQGRPALGQSSRFIAVAGEECDTVKSLPGFALEGEGEYLALAPDRRGACAADTVPVRRFNNLQSNVNHRYVADERIAAEMRSRGWYDEGVRLCARPLGENE